MKTPSSVVDCIWNVMAHSQKPNFVFQRNGRVNLNQRGRQLSRLLATEVCSLAVAMLDTPCSEVVWRVLATHSIRQFSLHFPSRASSCAVTFHLNFTSGPILVKFCVRYRDILPPSICELLKICTAQAVLYWRAQMKCSPRWSTVFVGIA